MKSLNNVSFVSDVADRVFFEVIETLEFMGKIGSDEGSWELVREESSDDPEDDWINQDYRYVEPVNHLKNNFMWLDIYADENIVEVAISFSDKRGRIFRGRTGSGPSTHTKYMVPRLLKEFFEDNEEF